MEALARQIAGPNAGADVLELARRVAEAELDLRRVRSARHQLLNRAWSDPDYESAARVREREALIGRWPRISLVTPIPDYVVAFLSAKPLGPVKLATLLSDPARQCRAMDRYERRARSRRKAAIRAYDISCKELSNLSKSD